MEENHTQELIMQEALQLFASKGYAAVSMRDIASAVGIRASSIYHHFGAKQEIFDALVQKADDLKEHLRLMFLQTFAQVQDVEEDAFIQAGVFFLTGYLFHEQVRPLLQVLECERFHSEEAQKAWSELLFQAPLEHEEKVFQMLIERGGIVGTDAKELAAQYQSAILLAYFTGDIEQLKRQLKNFYQRTFRPCA